MTSSNKIVSFFYRENLSFNTGEKTRLIELIKAYNDLGYKIDLYFIDTNKTGKCIAADFLNNLNITLKPKYTKGSTIKDLLFSVKYIYKNRKIIKLERVFLIGIFPLYLAPLIKIINPASKIFWSIPGAFEEMKYSGCLKRKYTYYVFKLCAMIAQLFVDRVIAVSRKMCLHLSKTLFVNIKKTSIVPCAVSNEIKYDKFQADIIRKNLHLEDKIIFVYIGTCALWQCAEETIDLFKKIKDKVENAHLMIISPNINEFETIFQKKGVEAKDYTVKSLTRKDISGFLSACNFGFLLRRNSIINTVSSPTKFAEYLACGLPVIMTKYVGDFSEIIMTQKLGTIINLDLNPEEINQVKDFIQLCNKNENNIKKNCIEYATKELSWRNFYTNLSYNE